jgi:penicillin-binding protein 2
MKIFLVLIAAVFAVVVARLWQLQVVGGEAHRREAEAALHSVELLAAGRGRILDRRGEILAMDKDVDEFCLDYRLLTGDRKWALREQRLIARREGLSMRRADRLFRRRAANARRRAARLCGSEETLDEVTCRIVRRVEAIRRIVGGDVREQLQHHAVARIPDQAAAARIRVELDDMVGASVRPGTVRFYPHGEAACHVVGLVGQVTAEEQQRLSRGDGRREPLERARDDYLDGDLIGKTGVEAACESVLRGRRGYRRLKRRATTFEELAMQPGEGGGTVRLALDIELQKRLAGLFRRMTAARNVLTGSREGAASSNGSIVVLSVPAGEVLALVSLPTYDPNHYARDFEALCADERNLPLLSRAVRRRYPPGSSVKPLAALAGLQLGVIDTHTEFDCRGYLHTPTAFRCWIYTQYRLGHGPLAVTAAIKNSCNIFFYHVGELIGMRRMAEAFGRFGFLRRPGTRLPEERAGIVADEGTRGQARLLAIGQGPVAVTPLHVANAMATIARDGEFLSPLLIRDDGRPRHRAVLPLRPEHLRAVQEGMFQVVNERGGTAYKQFHAPGSPPLEAEAYGKTGTASAPPADLNADGRLDAYERERNEMAWFAGFAFGRGAPAGRRHGVAFSVVVEYATGGASRNAAPIGREVVRVCREMGYLN